ncbi:MAG: hypothetical protein O6918_11410 [Deltaproteobacteria bacterium]|nr:hypothetical protein [Deltaproteobacteria bacterium]
MVKPWLYLSIVEACLQMGGRLTVTFKVHVPIIIINGTGGLGLDFFRLLSV